MQKIFSESLVLERNTFLLVRRKSPPKKKSHLLCPLKKYNSQNSAGFLIIHYNYQVTPNTNNNQIHSKTIFIHKQNTTQRIISQIDLYSIPKM